MTLWWGRLKFRRHKPWKVTKYEMLVRMVCVTVLDNARICNNGDIRSQVEEAAGHSIVTFRQNVAQNQHIFLDNFSNSMRLAETLLGTVRANSGIPPDVE